MPSQLDTMRRHVQRALDDLRQHLLPSLSPRQRRAAAGVEQQLRQALGEGSPANQAPAPTVASDSDSLQAALVRLDECIGGQLRHGRLNRESRRFLHRQLQITAQSLRTGHPGAPV